MVIDNCIAQRSGGDSSGQVHRSVGSPLAPCNILISQGFATGGAARADAR